MTGISSIFADDQSVPPRRGLIENVAPIQGTIVRIEWMGGLRDELDLRPALLLDESYNRLASDQELFNTVAAVVHGTLLRWADGTMLRVRSVAALTELRLSNAEFREAMSLLGMKHAAMAAHLDISERQVGHFRRDKRIPHHIALAVRHLLRRRLDQYMNAPFA